MTATASAHPQPRKQTVRPSLWRVLASKYVDLLICGFIAWVICSTFAWHSLWTSLTLFLWVGEWFWCRDRLNPTAGEYCLGIRYLTSSSSQVVADIQVINAKLRLNGFILTAGVVDLTLAFLFLCGWTFLGKAVLFGLDFGPPLSLLYWVLSGFLFFLCSSHLLCGSKNALWSVPLVHAWFMADFLKSLGVWTELFQSDLFFTSWMSAQVIHMAKFQSPLLLGLFGLWSLFVFGVVFFSRKLFVN